MRTIGLKGPWKKVLPKYRRSLTTQTKLLNSEEPFRTEERESKHPLKEINRKAKLKDSSEAVENEHSTSEMVLD